MKRILVTGFEPFSHWKENSSALCVSALNRRDHPAEITTRIYPVDFDRARFSVERDQLEGFDFALHLGQHEMSSSIRLERVAHNLKAENGGDAKPLLQDGKAELHTTLPLRRWHRILREEGIPVTVSNDPGCYLCNAVYYWSLYYSAQGSFPTRSVFIHLPLARTQVMACIEYLPSLSTEICADAVEKIIRELSLQSPPSVKGEGPAFAVRATGAQRP
jgi:pyroglutamyl-peptidase